MLLELMNFISLALIIPLPFLLIYTFKVVNDLTMLLSIFLAVAIFMIISNNYNFVIFI